MDDQPDRRGWIKLWRKWQQHEMASDPNATIVFLHLLTSASLDTYVNRRFGYTVQRGESDLTIAQLCQLTRLSRDSVREALSRLVRYGTVTRPPRIPHRPSITTIVNFNTYNPTQTDDPHQTPTEPPLNPHSTPRLEEVKKLRSTTTTLSDKSDDTDTDSDQKHSQKTTTYSPEFESFWSQYPRKAGKGAAWRVWKRLAQSDRQGAVDRAEWFRGCWEHHDPFGSRAQYIPLPATWLSQRRWEDDDAAVELMARGK